MSKTLFIKMTRNDEGLEQILALLRKNDCLVTELSARRSIDDAFYFVRLALESKNPLEKLSEQLSALSDIRCVESDLLAQPPGGCAA